MSKAEATAPQRRAARAARPHRLRDGARADLLRWHAAPARPRREPHGRPGRAVPRRADHRPRPGEPQPPVGHARRPRRPRHHGHPHHAVPRGGRPHGRRHRRPRPRADRRARHAGPSSSCRSAATGSTSRSRPSADLEVAQQAPSRRSSTAVRPSTTRRTCSRCRSATACAASRCSARSTTPASTRSTSPVARSPSTTCSSPSPAPGPMLDEPEEPEPAIAGGQTMSKHLLQRRDGARPPQPRAHPPGPGEAHERHDPTADVRAAVRVRLRRRDPRARAAPIRSS